MSYIDSPPLPNLVPLAEYQQHRPHLFPSPHSLTWYVRRHRDELVEDGALVLHTGRWLAVPDRFDAFVLYAGKRAAQKNLQAKAAP